MLWLVSAILALTSWAVATRLPSIFKLASFLSSMPSEPITMFVLDLKLISKHKSY